MSDVRALNRAMRARWLLAVAEDPRQLSELLEASATKVGAPLRSISLVELIATTQKCSKAKSKEMTRRIVSVSSGGTGYGVNPTIGWLIDPRAGGRRIAAFADSLTSLRKGPPWAGFPWTPEPAGMK